MGMLSAIRDRIFGAAPQAPALPAVEAIPYDDGGGDQAMYFGPGALGPPAYGAAVIDRLTRNWLPRNVSGDDAIGSSWLLGTARARDQLRNDTVIRSAERVLAKHTVGTGIASYCEALLAKNEPYDDFNDQSDDEFERFCDEEFDIEGRLCFGESQNLALQETAGAGEVLVQECWSTERGRRVPLCYKMYEAEQLDERKDQPRGERQNKIVRGVELDANDRPVAYWLRDAHPYDSYSTFSSATSQRIPARYIRHLYMPGRPSEHRGISWWISMMQASRDLDWYVGNELTAAAIGALLTVLFKKKSQSNSGAPGFVGPGGDAASTDWNGNPTMRLGRGTIVNGGPEDDVEIIESKRPNRDAEPFIKLLLRLQAMGAGMSYLRLSGDYRESSYTSARGAHLDDQAWFRVVQAWMGRNYVLPIRRRFNEVAVAMGVIDEITPREFNSQRARFQRFQLMPPGREQMDPEAETQAAGNRVREWQSNVSDELAPRGHNFRKFVRKREWEWRYAQAHGFDLESYFGAGTGKPALGRPSAAAQDRNAEPPAPGGRRQPQPARPRPEAA